MQNNPETPARQVSRPIVLPGSPGDPAYNGTPTRSPRPIALPVLADNIPDELKLLTQFVVWRYTWDIEAAKWTKPPLQPKDGNASSHNANEATYWTSFAFALSRYAESQSKPWRFDGIGLVLRPENNIVGFDLDDCHYPATGEVQPWALDLVHQASTYWEISPSGTGLRGFGYGRKPGSRCRTGDFEMYASDRYLCLSGRHLDGTPTTIEPIQAAIDVIYAAQFPDDHHRTGAPTGNGTGPASYDDMVILDAARKARNAKKFIRLYDHGDLRTYVHKDGRPDPSRADLALVRMLSFYTTADDQLDRLVRSSRLCRPKWESRADYRASTIAKAVASTHEHWAGPPPSVSNDDDHEAHTQEAGEGHEATQDSTIGPPLTLPEVIDVFKRWLHMPHLLGALHVLLGTYAANQIPGDPLWLMIVGGSGWGKTALLLSMIRLPRVHLASTFTEASLLSGTARKEKCKDATGGILKTIGTFGYLLCKDFTSVLSMNRESSTVMLAALREIFDGSWTRHVGVDGGRTLHWEGKLALIAGCTGAIDRFHAVVGALGERFCSYRLQDLDAKAQGNMALKLAGKEMAMRSELTDAVVRLFAGVQFPKTPPALTAAEQESLVALATLAAHCRSAVERDSYRRDIDLILDAEAPARLALSLLRLYGGMQAIGVEVSDARPLIAKVALDCMPALRHQLFDRLMPTEDHFKTDELAVALGHPTQTTRRSLEDLAAQGIVHRHKANKSDEWSIDDEAYTLFSIANKVFPYTFPEDRAKK
jgi:hypothetical protein